jgi:NADP-dependent 3-hydroxy acid dehydrogenase YdfG
MECLANAVVFVAGGSSGIGLAVAKALCANGAQVAITYRREDHLAEARAQFQAIGHVPLCIKMDVTDRAAFESAAQEVERALGPVDVFCNSAGVSIFGPMEAATYEDWDWVFDVNVGGVINGLMTFVPRMIKRGRGGHIVTIGSMAAFLAGPEAGLYSASKFAVRGIMENLRLTVAKHGIGVSLVSPGLVNSNIHEAMLSRPKALASTGAFSGDVARAMIKDALNCGVEPTVVGDAVVKGIQRNQFHIFTHPGFTGDLQEIHLEITAAQPAGEVPAKQLRIEEERRRMVRNALAQAQRMAADQGNRRAGKI